MASKHKHLASLIAMTFFLLMNGLTVEAAPSLVNIGVGTNGETVVINARWDEGFTSNIEEAIEDGIPITFKFEAELRQSNTLWNDTLISSNTIKQVIK